MFTSVLQHKKKYVQNGKSNMCAGIWNGKEQEKFSKPTFLKAHCKQRHTYTSTATHIHNHSMCQHLRNALQKVKDKWASGKCVRQQ